MIDYTGVAEALADVFRGVDSVATAGYEVDQRDLSLTNMPIIDVRPADADNEIRAGQDYVTALSYQCDLYTFALSDAKKAATLRDTILKDAQNAVRANPQFHVDLETSFLGAVEFSSTGKDEDVGAYSSLASFAVIAIVFTDRSS
jgi:hypothetical protein